MFPTSTALKDHSPEWLNRHSSRWDFVQAKHWRTLFGDCRANNVRELLRRFSHLWYLNAQSESLCALTERYSCKVRNIPIILSSGYLSPDARKRMNGSVKFIPKPIDEAAQIAMVQPRQRHLQQGQDNLKSYRCSKFFPHPVW